MYICECLFVRVYVYVCIFIYLCVSMCVRESE